MYVSIFTNYNPCLLEDMSLVSHQILISQEKLMWNRTLLKNQENPKRKNCTLILSGTVKKRLLPTQFNA